MVRPWADVWGHSHASRLTNLQNPHAALDVYRGFYLNLRLGNMCVSGILYYFQTVVTSIFVLCMVVVIHFGNKVNGRVSLVLLGLAYFCMLIWLLMLHISGLIKKKTSGWVARWKKAPWLMHKAEKRYLVKVGKSLRPITVNFSGFYQVTLIRVVKYVTSLMAYTVKGLLLLKKARS